MTEESDPTNTKISSDCGLLGLLLEKHAAPIFRVEVCWERKWLDYVVWMHGSSGGGGGREIEF
jgi:hypothetical protein